ncbi:protein of unknown function [Glycomyces sambucus]|uniref:DUF397 domain-containing protein n=1 Tax=Glycomyces sambucus TaxID=380244 RepID=A0A1G9DX07_9ACTN|nr:DUF397 domain-containing protein [Glycomyces sambucus]SDK68403.1 protein of unknown function [Glycomyces sambucus]
MRPTGWRKSSRSAPQDNCVEARNAISGFQVRDSKLGEGSPVLELETADFIGLLRDAKRP